MSDPDNPAPDPRLEQFQDYFNKVSEWLSRHWGHDPVCPVCSSTEWTIAPMVETPIRPGEMGELFRGKAVPLVPVICNTCSHVMWFQAIKMGVSEPGTLPPPPEATPQTTSDVLEQKP